MKQDAVLFCPGNWVMYACEKMSFHLKITEMGGNYEMLVDAVIRADQTNFKRQFCECHKSLFIFLNYISTVTNVQNTHVWTWKSGNGQLMNFV